MPNNSSLKFADVLGYEMTKEGNKIVKRAITKDWSVGKAKTALKEEVTAYRFEQEQAGITTPSGIRVKTGLDDQNRIVGTIASAELTGQTEFNFKSEQGWIVLNIEQIKAIGRMIANYIQACFNAEMQCHQKIDTLTTLEQLRAFNISEEFVINVES